MSAMSYQELSKALAVQSMKDPAFRRALVSDPNGTFEKYAGQPAGVKLFVHENSAEETHFVLPPPINKDELSDEDLEKVAGGEFIVGVLVFTVLGAAVGAGAAVANDMTRTRAGW